ncbi:unnamed protein product, partial [Dovyalis caffra]
MVGMLKENLTKSRSYSEEELAKEIAFVTIGPLEENLAKSCSVLEEELLLDSYSEQRWQ